MLHKLNTVLSMSKNKNPESMVEKLNRLNEILYNSSAKYVEILEKLKDNEKLDRETVHELFKLHEKYDNVFKFFNFYHDVKLSNKDDIEIIQSALTLCNKISKLIDEFLALHKNKMLVKLFKLSPVALSGIMKMSITSLMTEKLIKSNLPYNVNPDDIICENEDMPAKTAVKRVLTKRKKRSSDS